MKATALAGILFRALMLVAVLGMAACDSVEERVEKHYARGMELLSEGEPAKATLEFRNALKLNENHAPSRFQIARAYERDGEMAAALSNYRLVTELDPKNVEARTRVAQFMLLGGKLEEARRYADEALTLAPRDPEALATQAAVRYRSGDTAGAVAMAREARKVDPKNLGAIVVLASERYAAGDVPAALALLDGALASNPREMSVNLLKLRILEAENDKEALTAHLVRMTELYPGEKAFRQALVKLRVAAGDTAGAERDLRAIVAADPADVTATLDLVRFIAGQSGAPAGRAELEARIATAPAPEVATRLRLALVEFDYATGDREAAVARLRGFVADETLAQTERDRARTLLARYEETAGNRAAARELLDAVLKDDSKNVEARTLRGAVLLNDNQPQAAIADLLVAADGDPRNTNVMLLLARAYERTGSSDLAAERLAAATRASGYDPQIAIAYAQLLQRDNQGPAAETVLSEAAARNPKSDALLGALAEQRLRLKNWDGAIEAAQALSALQGNAAAAQRVRAATLSAQGRFDESIGVLQDLAADDPVAGDGAMTQLVGVYMRNNEAGKAQALIDEKLAAEPDNYRALVLRAEIKMALGETAAAEAALKSAIAAAPGNETGYAALARFYLLQGQDNAAEKILREGIARVGQPRTVRLLLAQMLEKRGEFDAAIAEYDTLYAAQPDSVVVANNLASLLAENHADDRASLERASQVAQRLRDETVPEFQDTYGWVLYLQGDTAGALRSLVPAAQARPNNPWIRFHAGMAFARLDRAEEARAHLDAALTLDPAFPRAAEARAALEALPTALQ